MNRIRRWLCGDIGSQLLKAEQLCSAMAETVANLKKGRADDAATYETIIVALMSKYEGGKTVEFSRDLFTLAATIPLAIGFDEDTDMYVLITKNPE